MATMTGQRSTRDAAASRDDDLTNRDVEDLMMPGNYLPRKHRDRAMPPWKSRLNAKPTNCVWTSETPK
jgi:hypothetical protein